jgi:hypothetical protein
MNWIATSEEAPTGWRTPKKGVVPIEQDSLFAERL